MIIEIICSFYDAERTQDIQRIAFAEAPTEPEFLFMALFMVMAKTRERFKVLRKISACHIVERGEATPEWLIANNGKYFFGV